MGNYCTWGGGGSTPTTAPGAPTVPPTTSVYWRASGETRNTTNGLLSGVVVRFAWPSGSPQTATSRSSPASDLGVFVMSKNAGSVPSSGNVQITASKTGSYAFEASNTNPGYGCSRINHNGSFYTGYSCPMSLGFNKPDPPPKALHFRERAAAAPTPIPPPACTGFSGPTSVTKGQSATYTINTSSTGGATTLGQLYWRCSNGSNSWTQVSADRSGNQPYSFTLNTNNVNCGAGSQTIQVIANVYRGNNCTNASCRATGNPSPAAGWTLSSACRKDVTVETLTPPTCSFRSGPSSIPVGSSGTFIADSNNARVLQMQYRQTGTSARQASGAAQVAQNNNPLMSAAIKPTAAQSPSPTTG